MQWNQRLTIAAQEAALLMNPPDGTLRRPIWRFAQCEYDELDDQLWIGSRKAELFPRSKAVLLALLKSTDHRMTRKDLLRTVWHAGEEMDGALSNAIHDLRSAISPEERDRVIRTLRGSGFQIVVPVERRIVEETAAERLRFTQGDAVPGLREWKLTEPLDRTEPHRIWLAERPSTGGHVHVFKFAGDGRELASLRREIVAAERLGQLGDKRGFFVAAHGWRDTTRPYYLETEFGGTNLLDWAEDQRNGAGLEREVCVKILSDLAEAVEAMHRSRIVHNDLRPEHILIRSSSDSGASWEVKLCGFSRAVFLEPPADDSSPDSGGLSTPPEFARNQDVYVAPELRAGGLPSRSSDIYALGILVFQILSGDFHSGLTSDWEKRITDPALCEDIRQAAGSDPAHRTARAGDLAASLRSAQIRSEHARNLQHEKERADQLSMQLALRSARLPWAIALVAALVAGLGVSLLLYFQAVRQRNLAEAVGSFLAEDVFTRASPYKTGRNTELLVDAVKAASPQIDRHFASEPLAAARLHATLARALDNRMDYVAGDAEYAEASALYRHAEGPLSQNAVITEMQRVAMHTRDTAPGHLEAARHLFDDQATIVAKLHLSEGELPIWVDYAQGLMEMFESNAGEAARIFQQGLDLADKLPHFDQDIALTMQQLLAVAEIRLGNGADAEVQIRRMMATVQRIHYRGKPNLVNLGVNLAQAYMAEQKNREAIEEVNTIYPALNEQMGESSFLTLTALGVRAQAEGNLGLWDDAARDSLTISRLGKTAFIKAGGLSDGALAECRGGRYGSGLAHVEEAFAVWKAEPNTDRAAESSFSFSRSTCLVGLGRLDEAQRNLNTVDVPALAQMNADADFPADVELTRAEIALGHRDYPAARAYLARAQDACFKPHAAPYRGKWFHRLDEQLQTGSMLKPS